MRDVESTRPSPPSHRRWLRFSIRSLLFIMFVIAVFSALFGKEIVRTQTERPIVAQIRAAGGSAYYDFQATDITKSPPGSPIVRSMLGDDIYATVNVVLLDDPKTTDANVAELHKLADLRDVSVSGYGVTDKCIPSLLRIKHLSSLNLYSTSITSQGLSRLSQAKTLQQLFLYGDSVTDAHLKRLGTFPSLQKLQVFRAPISDRGIKSIGSVTSLQELQIGSTSTVTDKGILHLARLTDLECLILLDCDLTDVSMTAISEMTELKALWIHAAAITDDGFRHLNTLKNIEVLQIPNSQIGDDSLAIVAAMPKLRVLDVSGTRITDDGLNHLKRLDTLERLDVGLGNGITYAGIQRLKLDRPSCVISYWNMNAKGQYRVINTL